MKIHSNSHFKQPEEGRKFIEQWYDELQQSNNFFYRKIEIKTSLGNTVVWSVNADNKNMEALVIFPGFRTCCGFWDFNSQLELLKKSYQVYLVDTNGQPVLSDGNTPAIKSDDYGWWAKEVLDGLKIEKATVTGASFGGLVCLKLATVAPEKVKQAILLNPGCLAPFSLSAKNLYYNLLPILFPTQNNVIKFLDNAVFYKSTHNLSGQAKKMIVDYELYVLQNFIDKAQKPYAFSASELSKIKSKVYLILGEKDILFHFNKSKSIAEKYLKNLKKTIVLPNTGHGIETSKEAMEIIYRIMKGEL